MAATPNKPRPALSLAEDESGDSALSPGRNVRTSVRIVPGGAHDTWAGFADTPTSSAATKFHTSFRSMGVKGEASPGQGTPKPAPKSTTAAAFAGNGEAPSPAVAVSPLGSQITFSETGASGSREGDLPPPKPVLPAVARDHLMTNVLCGEERPSGDGPPPPSPLPFVPADAKACAALTLPELRLALRARGLSPAGARATLIERLVTGLQDAATAPLLLPSHEHASGVGSGALSAAYARADGLVSDAPVHRGAGAPPERGDVAALVRGAAPSGPEPPPPHVSDAARAQLASHVLGSDDAAEEATQGRAADPRRVADMQGCDIFTVGLADAAPWSAHKAADYKGSGIFDDGAAAAPRPLPGKRAELGGHIVLDGALAAEEESPAVAPGLGLSFAKSEELSGGDVFAAAAEALPTPPARSARKAAELDSSVFAEPEDAPSSGRRAAPAFGGPSPPAGASVTRVRDLESSAFDPARLGPQPRKEPSPAAAKHAAAIFSNASAEGCTMDFAAPTAAEDAPLPSPSAGGRTTRKSYGGGASSVVFG